MHLTPDQIILFQHGIFKINATLCTTWILMLFLVLGSLLLTRNLGVGAKLNKWQNFLELVLSFTRKQLSELGLEEPDICVPLIATIFLFISIANLAGVIPGFFQPTASLSTTAALAATVFIAVPFYGISRRGPLRYFKSYLKPLWIMLPFNILGEFTRTIALAVRLFGNSMSASMVVAVCLSIAPIFFPVLMHVLGLLTGLVQAYIFAVLASLYIAAGVVTHEKS